MQVELLFNLPSGGLPREVRLFGYGWTETTKGRFLFDEKAAADVMATFSDHGIDRLPIDINHGMVVPHHPDDAKAAGWFVPVVKEDPETGGVALYASNIEWTPKAEEALSMREFRFHSPAILYDEKTRRIKRLINLALTNIPATKGQAPLVLSDAETPNQGHEMQVLLSALGAHDEAGAVDSVRELQSFRDCVLSALNVDAGKAADAIAALSAAKAEAETKLAAIEAERVEEKKQGIIASLSAEGKLPPAQRKFAESLSLEVLSAFAETLSAVVAPRGAEEPASSGKVETLSDEEKKIAISLGISEETFLKGKVK